METPRKYRLFPSLLNWKFWRVLLLIVAGFITLLALYHAEENLRGKRAWENYKRAKEAEGESFDFANYRPPSVPGDQNFAMTPFLAPLFDYFPGTQKPRDTNAVTRAVSIGAVLKTYRHKTEKTWIEDKPIDLVTIANTWTTNGAAQARLSPAQLREAASEILENLKPVAPVLEEMRTACKRPYSRFNVDYNWPSPSAIRLQHLSVIRELCALLQMRACAELALGQTETASQDIALMFHLMNSLQSEPFLITHLVRATCLTQMLQPMWEGLSRHQWSDAQLAGFDRQLRTLNFLDDAARSLRSERHLYDSFFVMLRSSLSPIRDLNNMGDDIGNRQDYNFFEAAFALLIPRGWIYFEQLNYHRLFDEEARDTITPRGIDPDVVDQKDANAHSETSSVGASLLHHKAIARLLLPNVTNFERKMARAQTYANLASIACALDRYRLAHGNYPESLDSLAPEFLPAVPRDVIMDQPLKYRRTDDGQFILYSVGWNKKDDNGAVAKEDRENTEGDWVWKYPASSQAK